MTILSVCDIFLSMISLLMSDRHIGSKIRVKGHGIHLKGQKGEGVLLEGSCILHQINAILLEVRIKTWDTCILTGLMITP